MIDTFPNQFQSEQDTKQIVQHICLTHLQNTTTIKISMEQNDSFRRPSPRRRRSKISAMSLQASKRYANRVDKYRQTLTELKRKTKRIESKYEEKAEMATELRNYAVDLDLEAAELRAENDVLRDTGRAHAQATATAEQMLSDVGAENASLSRHLAELRHRCQLLEKKIDSQHQEIKLKAQTSMLIQQGRQAAQTASVAAQAREQVLQGNTPTIAKPYQDFNIVVKKGAELRKAVRLIFSRYDTDGTGDIDVEELTEMVFDFQCSFPDLYVNTPPLSPRRVARDVIERLDKDGNGELDHREFYSWLAAGIEMSRRQREIFAEKGPLKAQMTSFLGSVERYVIIMQQKELKTKKSVDAVRDLF